MAVDEQQGAREQTRRHGHGVAVIEADEHKAEPGRAVAFGAGFQVAQEGFFEFENTLDAVGSDGGPSGMGGSGEEDIFELIAAGGKDGGTLVDFGGIEQIEDREMLDGEDFVHAFEAEAALAVEEVGDVGLLESGLLGEVEAR